MYINEDVEMYKENLRAAIMEEMLSIIEECAPVDRETLDEFLEDTEFLDHVWEEGFNGIDFESIAEGEEIRLLVEYIPTAIAEVFDDMYDAIEMH